MTWHAAISALTNNLLRGYWQAKGIGFLETFQNPIDLKKILIAPVIKEKSEIKNKTKQKYKFLELLIPTINIIISYHNTYFIGMGKS